MQVERNTWDSTTKGPKTFITLLKAKHITQCSDSPLRLNLQIHKLQLHNMFAVKRSTDDKKNDEVTKLLIFISEIINENKPKKNKGNE